MHLGKIPEMRNTFKPRLSIGIHTYWRQWPASDFARTLRFWLEQVSESFPGKARDVAAIGEFSSGPTRRIDSLDAADEVKVAVGGNDLLYLVVDHSGGVEGVPRVDLGVGFQKFDR